MAAVLLDTQTLLLWTTDERRLSARVQRLVPLVGSDTAFAAYDVDVVW